MSSSSTTASPKNPALRPRPTTIVEAPRLAARLGVDLFLAVETFQETGSFKFRAAANVAANVPNEILLAASSGNFGQALARAAKLAGKRAIIVMPDISAQVKIDAVREFGGEIVFVDTSRETRAAKVAEVFDQHPDAYLGSAYDDPFVISGNASLGHELAALAQAGRPFDSIVVPLGGGGLTSGMVTGLRDAGWKADVWAAEPLLANDGARSLRAGHIVRNETEGATIADGARTQALGNRNWEILKDGLAGVIEVDEDQIREGVRLLSALANVKAEPTGALPTGALLAAAEKFSGQRVCCVVSGGNVDPKVYLEILSGGNS
ncbi:MAG: threonine/serine dehydratase, partial [Thermoanaerobaculia bacterium]